jgi:hypothetical protein
MLAEIVYRECHAVMSKFVCILCPLNNLLNLLQDLQTQRTYTFSGNAVLPIHGYLGWCHSCQCLVSLASTWIFSHLGLSCDVSTSGGQVFDLGETILADIQIHNAWVLLTKVQQFWIQFWCIHDRHNIHLALQAFWGSFHYFCTWWAHSKLAGMYMRLILCCHSCVMGYCSVVGQANIPVS